MKIDIDKLEKDARAAMAIIGLGQERQQNPGANLEGRNENRKNLVHAIEMDFSD